MDFTHHHPILTKWWNKGKDSVLEYIYDHKEKEKWFLLRAVKPFKLSFSSALDLGLNWHHSADCYCWGTSTILKLLWREYVQGMQLSFGSFKTCCLWTVSVILCVLGEPCSDCVCACVWAWAVVQFTSHKGLKYWCYSGIGDDHGPTVWRCVLCWHRHRPRAEVS